MDVNVVQLAKSFVLDSNGQKIPLSDIWKKKTTIFVFLRHFACLACRAHAKQVWEQRHQLIGEKTQLVFIGNGNPQYIEAFKEDLGLQEAVIYTDPTLEVFRSAGFKRGFLAAIGPRALKNGRTMYKEGHQQGNYSKGQGDLWQLGGVLVMTPDGRVTYHYISQVLGDYPPDNDLEGN